MIEREPSRLEQILAKYGQRWLIERDGLVWTATEHPSPTALHVIIAHDLEALEQKIIEAELPAEQRSVSRAPLGTTWGPHGVHAAEQPAGGRPPCPAG
jgi:hypothetical protein